MKKSVFNKKPKRHTFANPMVDRLTWDIQIKKVYSDNTEAKDYKAIHRNDNRNRLNIVSSSYNPGTNEKFMETVTKLHELTGFKIVGYSEFDGGRKVLAYLQNTEPVKIGDFDTTNYMIKGNSFDYSMSWFAGLTKKVHRCSNEWGMIRPDHRFRHDSKLNENLDRLVEFYQAYVDQEKLLKEKFETWCRIRVPEAIKELFADQVLNISKEQRAEEKISKIKLNQRKSLFDSINKEIGAMGNNAYGLFNGLTHYTTHVAKSKEKVFGNVLGYTAALNNRGFKMLNEYVEEVA